MSIMIASDNTYRPALNDNQLRRFAPAIFATTPVEAASDRYSFIPTIDVVNGLREHGWLPVAAKQTQAKSASRVDTRLHMVRFRHPDLEPIALKNGNLIFPEAIMTNSHNLSNAFKFMMGAYQMLCSNGLVAGESFGSLTVRHNSTAIDEAIKSCFEMLANAKPMMAQINQFREIELNPQQRNAFARSALNMKHGVHGKQLKDGEEKPHIVYGDPREAQIIQRTGAKVEYIPMKPAQLLEVRRSEDREPTLWNTFNVIQENLLKGGQSTRSTSWKRNRSKGVNAIEKDLNINRNLWGMAEYLAEHVANA